MANVRQIKDASSLAREHTELAIETLADAAANAFKDSDRIAAANALLDRGHGKPLSVAVQVPMNRQVAEQLARMSDSDLMNVIEGTVLPDGDGGGEGDEHSAAPALEHKHPARAYIARERQLAAPERDPLLD